MCVTGVLSVIFPKHVHVHVGAHTHTLTYLLIFILSWYSFYICCDLCIITTKKKALCLHAYLKKQFEQQPLGFTKDPLVHC